MESDKVEIRGPYQFNWDTIGQRSCFKNFQYLPDLSNETDHFTIFSSSSPKGQLQIRGGSCAPGMALSCVICRAFDQIRKPVSGKISSAGEKKDHSRTASSPTATGSPEAITRLRLPRNVACGFPALRSSDTDSQHSDGLELPVGESQPWSLQRIARLDSVENLPRNMPLTTATAQHFVPVPLHEPMHSLQGPEVPSDAVVAKVAPQHPSKIDHLLLYRQMPYTPHQVA